MGRVSFRRIPLKTKSEDLCTTKKSRATVSLRRTPGPLRAVVSHSPRTKAPAIKPLGPPPSMPAVLQVTAAINSYNEHYVMTTHEQLCPKRAQPLRAFLQLTGSCKFRQGRDGRER
jgi:hypothetical protein